VYYIRANRFARRQRIASTANVIDHKLMQLR
jgi:hypothetical protein